jgi:tRNA wybutosine-synthesizing protein 2
MQAVRRGPRISPAERVRVRIRDAAGPELASSLPEGYQRLGRVLLLRLPESLRPFYPTIGAAWQAELDVSTVLAFTGPVAGEYRVPQVECIAGSETETEVIEHGIRWRLDASRIMFAAGNRTERRRAGTLVRPGEDLVDLFAGIGYFTIPAARLGRARQVVAVEKNPEALGYLATNVALNRVADRVRIVAGDNRTVPLPERSADRIFLGYLPSSVSWIPRALTLLRASGGWLHVHTTADARDAQPEAIAQVERALGDAGGQVAAPLSAREVKPYGPGRTHVVVDAHVVPSDQR